MRVLNLGKDAYRVSCDGINDARPIKNGEVIYQGRARLCGLGTIPYYGFKMKMFPYAQTLNKRMHLRLTTIGPTSFIGNLLSIWRGTYEAEKNIFDFLVERIAIELPNRTATQVGGDPQGARTEFRARLSPFEVELLNFKTS